MVRSGLDVLEQPDPADASWTPQQPLPPGLVLENLRKIGNDEIRLYLDTRHRHQPFLVGGFSIAAITLLLGLSAGALALGVIAASGIVAGTLFRSDRAGPTKWRLSVTAKAIELRDYSLFGRLLRTRSVPLPSIESIGLDRRFGIRDARLRINTHHECLVFGEGSSEVALAWLRNYLAVEFAGLTWRPIQAAGQRTCGDGNGPGAPNPLMLKPDLALRLITIYLAEAPGMLTKLRAAVEAGNAVEIRKQAHWLKSASANVGARHLSELSQLVEHCAIDGELSFCPLLFKEIEQAFPGVTEWLNSIRNSAEEKMGELTQLVAGSVNPAAQVTSDASGTDTSDVLPARVLVVDDSTVSSEIAAEFLSDWVQFVEFAKDGREAVEAWKNGQFDLIFMDCEMITMNGFEATVEIRRLEAERSLKRTPIVALTGSVHKNDREKCLASGMDDYIAKPYAPEKLKSALDNWLGKDLPGQRLRGIGSEMASSLERIALPDIRRNKGARNA